MKAISEYLSEIDAFLREKSFSAAEDAIELALFAYPKNPWISIKRGELLAAVGDHDGARTFWAELIQAHPDLAIAYHRYIDECIKLERVAIADEVSKIAVERFQDIVWLHYQFADLGLSQHGREEAIKRWKLVVSRFPETVWPVYKLIELLDENLEIDELLEICRKSYEEFPNDTHLYMKYTYAVLRKGDHAQLLAIWRPDVVSAENYRKLWEVFIRDIPYAVEQGVVELFLNQPTVDWANNAPEITRYMGPASREYPERVQPFLDRIAQYRSYQEINLIQISVLALLGQRIEDHELELVLKHIAEVPDSKILQYIFQTNTYPGLIARYRTIFRAFVTRISSSGQGLDTAQFVAFLKIALALDVDLFNQLKADRDSIVDPAKVHAPTFESMLSKKIHFSGKKTKKIAVSVSGQLRGYRSAFATWKMLNDNSGIELNFFVHTWKKIGVNLPTEHNANRCFEDRLARAYASLARERGTPYLHEKFANLTSFFRNSNFADDAELRDFYDAKIVVIEPDEDFDGKSNSWKMYYKIKEGFRIASGYDDYDAYIRIRPDRAITSLEKNAIFDMAEASRLSQDIFTEMAASYFASLPDLAIGDQFALGDPWAMKRYCDAFDLVTQKSENPELIGMYYELVPHCTVAGAALLQGVLPRAALGMRFGSFLNADRIRPDLALELIECDLASGADDEGQALLRAARADVKA